MMVVFLLSGRPDKFSIKAETEELQTAVRVLTRLGGINLFDDAPTQTDAENVPESASDDDGKTLGKPDGLPTMPTLIMTILRECQRQDVGLEPREIVEGIRHRFWPDAPTDAVGPIAWRMWKRKELDKVGSRYRLPQKRFSGMTGEELGKLFGPTADDEIPSPLGEGNPGATNAGAD